MLYASHRQTGPWGRRPIVPTVWDPTKTAGDGTLSFANGNRDGASSGFGNHDTILSVAPISSASGRCYWEVEIISAGLGVYLGIQQHPFSPLGRVMWYGAGAAPVYVANPAGGEVVAANWATFGAGDVIGLAVDWSARLFWGRKNGGTWQGGGDPSAGTGGITFAPSVGAEWYAQALIHTTTVRLNAGQDAFVGAVPAGFDRGLGPYA